MGFKEYELNDITYEQTIKALSELQKDYEKTFYISDVSASKIFNLQHASELLIKRIIVRELKIFPTTHNIFLYLKKIYKKCSDTYKLSIIHSIFNMYILIDKLNSGTKYPIIFKDKVFNPSYHYSTSNISNYINTYENIKLLYNYIYDDDDINLLNTIINIFNNNKNITLSILIKNNEDIVKKIRIEKNNNEYILNKKINMTEKDVYKYLKNKTIISFYRN